MSNYRIGMNLRVTEDSNQGDRRHMEDRHAIRFVKNDDGGFEFAYFGIFDGHGGGEASKYARYHLLDEILKYDCFWSDIDDDILWAIKSAFIDCHHNMWKDVVRWPKTLSGLPSTAGTTASICIIKNSKLYIGHVGDSAIALGSSNGKNEKIVKSKAKMLTQDHKPEDPAEWKRIESSGGRVVNKSGVVRVVWNRPRTNKGPVRRSTQIDQVPFLAIARSLGDFWSYNYLKDEFVVSPEPDVSVHILDPDVDKCLIIGSDGLWNMMTAEEAVISVFDMESQFEQKVVNDLSVPLSYWINPAERLVHASLNKWRVRHLQADNTSAIVVLLDPLGPRKLSILKKKREERMKEILGTKLMDNIKGKELPEVTERIEKLLEKDIDKSGVPMNDQKMVTSELRKIVDPDSLLTKSVKNLQNAAGAASRSNVKVNIDNNVQTITRVSPWKLKSMRSPKTSSCKNVRRTEVTVHSSPQKLNVAAPSLASKSVTCKTHDLKRKCCWRNKLCYLSTKSAKLDQQKFLQACKNTENMKLTSVNQAHSDIKIKHLENFCSTDDNLDLTNSNLKSPQKLTNVKRVSISSSEMACLRSGKKPHSKSLTTRISLQMRLLIQRTRQSKNHNHVENKSLLVKACSKRKTEPNQDVCTHASKKIRHS